MKWDYFQPVKICFGKGRVSEIKDLAKKLGLSKGLLVADPFFFTNGLAERIIEESEGSIIASFGELSPNPDVSEVDTCAKLIRDRDIGYVVALGGGSAMDCAKAAATICLTDDSIRKYHGTGVPVPQDAVGVYYRKDNPNKPYTVRLFKMCKSKAEARKYLKYAHRFDKGSCRIALHKSSAQRYEKKAWEFVVQATFRHLWEATLLRAVWSEQITQISKYF